MIKKYIATLHKNNRRILEIVQGTLLAVVLKVAGAGLSFGFNVVVARLLGAEGAGVYFLAFAITTIGSVIGRVGLDSSLLRFVATHAAHEEWSTVKGVHKLSIRVAVVASGIVAFGFFLTSPWIGQLFNKQEIIEPLRWMSLSILPLALIHLNAQSLLAVKRVTIAMIVQGIGVPLVGLILIVPLANSAGLVGVSFGFLLSTLVILILSILAWKQVISNYSHPITAFSFENLWSSCRHLWGVSVLNGAVLPWMPLFLLGIWSTSEEVGVFGAAQRIAILVTFFLGAINGVVAPQFADLYSRGDIDALGKLGRYTVMILTAFAAPLLLVMITAGKWVMGLYGAGFEQGYAVLAILSVGELVNALCGPVGLMLTMSGHEKNLRSATFIALFFQLVLGIILIPFLGMEGAALATAAGVILNNLIAVVYVRQLIGVAYPFKIRRRGG